MIVSVWQSGWVPHNWNDASVEVLLKNKDKTVFGNNWAMSLVARR